MCFFCFEQRFYKIITFWCLVALVSRSEKKVATNWQHVIWIQKNGLLSSVVERNQTRYMDRWFNLFLWFCNCLQHCRTTHCLCFRANVMLCRLVMVLFFPQAMACIQSNLYVYGGTTGFVYNTELHRLDLNKLVWEKMKPNNVAGDIPPERYFEMRRQLADAHKINYAR